MQIERPFMRVPLFFQYAPWWRAHFEGRVGRHLSAGVLQTWQPHPPKNQPFHRGKEIKTRLLVMSFVLFIEYSQARGLPKQEPPIPRITLDFVFDIKSVTNKHGSFKFTHQALKPRPETPWALEDFETLSTCCGGMLLAIGRTQQQQVRSRGEKQRSGRCRMSTRRCARIEKWGGEDLSFCRLQV